ncbi:MAG: hypothetical protein AAGI69_00550 [Cyanobacteria bacterium P01_H01_bin.21]
MKSTNKVFDFLEYKVAKATQIDTQSICIFRIIFGLFTLFFGWKSYSWLGSVPDTFFSPPVLSIASLFSEFPPSIFFYGLDVCIATAVIALTIGAFTRFSTTSLFVLLVVANSFNYSLGKIDHGFLYLCVLLVMQFKNWGEFFSVDYLLFSRQKKLDDQATSQPLDNLWLLAVFIAFGFFTAGFGKAIAWLDFDLSTSGFLSWLYNGYYNLGRDQLLASFVIDLDWPLLWELLDISAVIFELGFLWAMFSQRSWYIWLTIACSFHLANCLLLNIPFTGNSIVYLAFVPWSQVGALRYLVTHHIRKILLAVLAVCGLALALSVSLGSSFDGLAYYFAEAAQLQESKLIIGCVLWGCCLFIFGWVIVRLKLFLPNGAV